MRSAINGTRNDSLYGQFLAQIGHLSGIIDLAEEILGNDEAFKVRQIA